MSRHKPNKPRRERPAPERDSVWVESDVTSDGVYVVAVRYGMDCVRSLNRSEAYDHAGAVLAAAQRAEHDCAVARQLMKITGLALDEVALMIRELRADRPPLDAAALAPLWLEPGINQETRPFLVLHADGQQVGQWTVGDARQHALYVLEALEAADLDAAYLRYLVGKIGIDDNRARQAIGDLANYRQR
ncbi:hypothetical protein DY218_27160 [Streptomyces triticagri]|uniref:Uncharacterized protein n=1 Tax=Streptomyces triticagri TaxID=2293568 RepID=A0A372LYZ4_9ACTN|nr:hypothetical protein [Streptomyces triticagri]RFU83590.1 hypothetical protein DY218_27160 [Streptomyces triticagri]